MGCCRRLEALERKEPLLSRMLDVVEGRGLYLDVFLADLATILDVKLAAFGTAHSSQASLGQILIADCRVRVL